VEEEGEVEENREEEEEKEKDGGEEEEGAKEEQVVEEEEVEEEAVGVLHDELASSARPHPRLGPRPHRAYAGPAERWSSTPWNGPRRSQGRPT